MIGGVIIYKKCAFISIILVIILSSCSANKKSISYSLGRSPFSSFIASSGEDVYYKSFALYKEEGNNELEEYRYQGLFRKTNSDDEPELIYSDFDHGLNTYSDQLFFINTKHQLLEYNKSTKNIEILVGDKDKLVSECLIINDNLFYILENTVDHSCVLHSYDLIKKSDKTIANDVHWERLNHFQNNLQFWKTDGTTAIYKIDQDQVEECCNYDMEVIQILDNKKVIGYANKQFIQCDLDGSNKKILCSVENLYNIVVTQNEIFYSTVDDETYTQLFRFPFASKKVEKITATKYPLVGYDGNYLYCASSSGMGDLERINIEKKVVESFDDRVSGSVDDQEDTASIEESNGSSKEQSEDEDVSDSEIDTAKKAVMSYYENTVFKGQVDEVSQIEDKSKFRSAVIPDREKDITVAFYVIMKDSAKRMIVLTKELSGEWKS